MLDITLPMRLGVGLPKLGLPKLGLPKLGELVGTVPVDEIVEERCFLTGSGDMNSLSSSVSLSC
jgi:hypothetical protein